MEELDFYVDSMNTKYSALLNYFGEDSNMNCQEFFQTLSRFMTDFIEVREAVERLRKQEEKKVKDAARKAAQDAGVSIRAAELLQVPGAVGTGSTGTVGKKGSPSKGKRRSSMF